MESKVEIFIKEGDVDSVMIKTVSGSKPLKGKSLKLLKQLLRKYSEKIVKMWVMFFVYNKPIKSKKINKKL